MRQEDATVDRCAMTDPGITTQNGCTGIHGDVVFERGMSFHTSSQATGFINRKALGPQGDALVDLAMIADPRGFTDHDACSMIHEERFTDVGTGVDVDSSS